MASLAELLDYDQRKRQALQALTDYASSQYKLGSAFGEGLSDQAKGLVQMARHPIDTAVDTATNIYQAGKAAIQNPRAAYQAAKEGLAETVNSPQNIARFAGQNFNPLELANALNKVGTMRELTVYHGTPHTLPPTANNPLGEFDASKIGTGEGAAAYGHGIYVAQNPSVAKEYSKDRSYVGRFLDNNGQNITWDAKRIAQEALDVHGKNAETHLEKVLKANSRSKNPDQLLANKEVENAIQLIKNNEITKKGNLYTVDLPDEKIDQMLDWDKPLSEQHPKVQKAFNTIAANDPDLPLDFLIKGNATGGSLIQAMDKVKASSLLRNEGIPGIKYLDEGSRSKSYQIQLSVKGKPYETDPIMFARKEQADKAAKDYAAKGFTTEVKNVGTRNFVVFPGEEKNLKILSRE